MNNSKLLEELSIIKKSLTNIESILSNKAPESFATKVDSPKPTNPFVTNTRQIKPKVKSETVTKAESSLDKMRSSSTTQTTEDIIKKYAPNASSLNKK